MGEIPSQLSLLKNLRFLWLRQNNLNGSIPRFLTNCSDLTVIDLSSNFITAQNKLAGNIPRSLGNCSSLTRINFSIHSLMGQIPSELSLLKSGDSSY
ncbi:hypothetical protein ACSBR2_001165 [Camellia fascicularis]